MRKPAVPRATTSAPPRENAPTALDDERAGSIATLPDGGPGSSVAPTPAAVEPVGDDPAVTVAPAEVDGAVTLPLAGGRGDVPAGPGAPDAPGRPGAGAPGADVRGAGGALVGSLTVGFGAGAVVGFGGGGGGAGAAGGAIPGRAPAPNAHPSTDPGAGSCPAAPSELYAHEPPRDACQYDQYAVVGGVRTHGSDAGAPLMRQTNPGPSCWVPVVANPALCIADSPELGSPAAQPTWIPPSEP
jgi:hypothetical protein